jgi:uncharacterized repeat protein (TIGR03803 family)
VSKSNRGMRACGIFLLWAATAVALPAQTFTTLYSFCSPGGSECTDGSAPTAGLVQGTDGNLYGTTMNGGNYSDCGSIRDLGCGTIFRITPDGALKILYSFCPQVPCTDGAFPEGGLIQGTDGNLYGTTRMGGPPRDGYGSGTVFKIAPGGTLTTLHSFDYTHGEYPEAGLIQGTNGDFYGTTVGGGANSRGEVFKITPAGVFRTLHSFDFTDGEYPSAIVMGADGNFYGTTNRGGANLAGTVFRMTPNGRVTTLHNFCSQTDCTDGYGPTAGLVQGPDDNLYGTAPGGGTYCTQQLGCGTVFKITPSGTLTTLHSFDGSDGEYPSAGLDWGSDGNFYGTTDAGGGGSDGTIFKITVHGGVTTLYNFCLESGCADGAPTFAELFQGTKGTFYGAAKEGGANNNGTVFSLTVGLGAFVDTQPAFGKVGAAVKILGSNLTGATSVLFNGIAVAFTVQSRTLIRTTVPFGVTSGTVQVATPKGALSSNVPFTVR